MKKRVLGFMALLLLVGISTKYVGGTYAKYTAQTTKSGTATVAKWDFAQDNAANTLTINLAQTHTSNLVADKIAPGTSGDFAVNVVNTDSEVGVDFTVQLDSITNIPDNLKFYTDSTHTNELVPGDTTNGIIEGYLTPNDSTGVDAHIYWAWAYETTDGDDEDTADGLAAETLTIGVTIDGIQTEPSSSDKGISRIK